MDFDQTLVASLVEIHFKQFNQNHKSQQVMTETIRWTQVELKCVLHVFVHMQFLVALFKMIVDQLVLFLQLCIHALSNRTCGADWRREKFSIDFQFTLSTRRHSNRPMEFKQHDQRQNVCPDCQANQLSIVMAGSSSNISLVRKMTHHQPSNRVVVVKLTKFTHAQLLAHMNFFRVFNIVLAEIDETGRLEVLAWGTNLRLRA